MFQTITAAENNINISLFEEKQQLWNDARWKMLESISSTSTYTNLFTLPLVLTGTPYNYAEPAKAICQRKGQQKHN